MTLASVKIQENNSQHAFTSLSLETVIARSLEHQTRLLIKRIDAWVRNIKGQLINLGGGGEDIYPHESDGSVM